MVRDLIRCLSEVPGTPKIAIPILELMMTLLQFPDLVADLESKHYENVRSDGPGPDPMPERSPGDPKNRDSDFGTDDDFASISGFGRGSRIETLRKRPI